MKNMNHTISQLLLMALFLNVSLKLIAQQSYTEFTSDHNGAGMTNEVEADLFITKRVNKNTSESDFGGYPIGEYLYYCSSDRKSEFTFRTDHTTGKPMYSLFRTDGKGEQWKREKVAESRKKVHVGPMCSFPDGKTVIVTVDNMNGTDVSGKRRLKLYKATIALDGELADFQELPFNSSDFSTGHPVLTADGNLLYFASDRPGGFGGVDLYKVSISATGEYGTPENLGQSVNTAGDEMFPWVSSTGEMLFFASNGHGGYGGLDLFVAYNQGQKWNDISNLGKSMNSSSDDFAFVLLNDSKTGYFSSNKQGGTGDDDIYYFELTKSLERWVTIEGMVADKRSGTPVIESLVELRDQNGNLIDTVITNQEGAFFFKVKPDQAYQLIVSKEDYLPFSNQVPTLGVESGSEVKKRLEIEKETIPILFALITDRQTKELLEGVKIRIIDNITGNDLLNTVTDANGEVTKLITDKKLNDQVSFTIELSKADYISLTRTYNAKIENEGKINVHESLDLSMVKIEKGIDIGKMFDLKPIYFEYNKFTITNDASIELDKIVKILNENPTMVIELGSHTDARGSTAANFKLSDNRAKASAAYIKKRITNPERIKGKGYGESKLLNICADGVTCSEEQHAVNRRTEFVIK